jgi:hypothetical protein
MGRGIGITQQCYSTVFDHITAGENVGSTPLVSPGGGICGGYVHFCTFGYYVRLRNGYYRCPALGSFSYGLQARIDLSRPGKLHPIIS